MYELVLLPVDGSKHADRAARRGFDLAEQFGADVHIVGVVETGLLGSIRLPGERESAENAFSREVRSIVDRTAAEADERGLNTSQEVRHGVPVTEILACVDEVGADLVVMSSRGRGGVDRLMLGSVTEGVTRYGQVDVLVVQSSPPE